MWLTVKDRAQLLLCRIPSMQNTSEKWEKSTYIPYINNGHKMNHEQPAAYYYCNI